jgi:transmembrane sensor
MKQEEAIALLDKYLTGECTPEEYRLLNQAYNLEIPKAGAELTAEEYETSKKLVLRRLQDQNPVIRPLKVRLWPRIAVAAAVALIVLGVYFFNAPRHPELVSGSPLANDIAPGRNVATLTLGNGKVINLSDAKSGVVVGEDLKYSDGSLIQNSSGSHFSGSLKGDQKNTGPVRVPSLGANEMITAITPRGGTYQVVLPDGTKVWLNADSKISFPVQFSGGIRKILLSGEGYFEVAKNKRMPFVVQTDKQTVTVLGTHFNINAYRDESNTRTTLLEGSVRVSRDDGAGDVMLKPNQQAVSTAGSQTKIIPADIEAAMAWKNGDFVFGGEDFKATMRKIARWYDVEIVYDAGLNENIELEGWISRSSKLSEVLRKIEAAGNIQFKIEGRRVLVTR